jgi:hypothetical protein
MFVMDIQVMSTDEGPAAEADVIATTALAAAAMFLSE